MKSQSGNHRPREKASPESRTGIQPAQIDYAAETAQSNSKRDEIVSAIARHLVRVAKRLVRKEGETPDQYGQP